SGPSAENDGPPLISAAQLRFADAATQVAATPARTERRESPFPAPVSGFTELLIGHCSELPLRRSQE
ncbi:hypothetical protein, partial [Bradyrhizobium embrapense]|uniref:hypothetical protein n=1 Tax=Bradyrhizobium embrapense TaxID=630921 RepID=UPI0019D32E58